MSKEKQKHPPLENKESDDSAEATDSKSSSKVEEKLGPSNQYVLFPQVHPAISAMWERMNLILNATNPHRALLGTTFDRANRISQLAVLQVTNGLSEKFSQLAAIGTRLIEAQKARATLYPVIAENAERLAQEGWFLSYFFDFEEFDQIAEIAQNDKTKLEAVVAQTYRNVFSIHAESIVREYPERAFAIEPAIRAHERGEFALSVPIFLAQAEGISWSKAGKYVFSRKEGHSEHISSLADEKAAALSPSDDDWKEVFRLLELALWVPLQRYQPIGYNETKRKEIGYHGLNRHTVLHGESLDYATELNSLKAFSFLSHMASLMALEKND